MENLNLKRQIDLLFDEMISKLSSHGQCVIECKQSYEVCLEGCKASGDPDCPSACRSKLEACINGCPDELEENEKKIMNEYLDKIDSLVKNS
ncbi:MAG: hypothetical protein ABIQ74_06965 [Chitinophagales bacterium]